MAGFFAGDGSVKSDWTGLAMGQSLRAAEVLVLFAKSFGGSIELQRTGSGTSFPMLRWQLTGSRARLAAGMLGKSQLEKQAQLLQLANGSSAGCQATTDMMRQWKQMPTEVEFNSWHEVAGFVDAEWCFAARRAGAIELSFSQKHKTSLEALQRFFSERLGFEVVSYMCERGSDAHQLAVEHKSSRKICEELLRAGLIQKRAQAELVLGHSRAEHSKVRAKLQELKGNQGRFRRQDNEGIARALEIQSLQTRRSHLCRSPRIGLPEVSSKVDELTVKIDELKEEHQRKELEREILAMQSHLDDVTRTIVLATGSSDLERSEPDLHRSSGLDASEWQLV